MVYRRWATKDDLVFAAVARMSCSDVNLDQLPDNGSLRGDMTAMILPPKRNGTTAPRSGDGCAQAGEPVERGRQPSEGADGDVVTTGEAVAPPRATARHENAQLLRW
jgi:hypothetical protein